MLDTGYKVLVNPFLNDYHVTDTVVGILRSLFPVHAKALWHRLYCSTGRWGHRSLVLETDLDKSTKPASNINSKSSQSDSKALYCFTLLCYLLNSPRQQLTLNSHFWKGEEKKKHSLSNKKKGHVVGHILVEKLVHFVNTADKNPSTCITVLPTRLRERHKVTTVMFFLFRGLT